MKPNVIRLLSRILGWFGVFILLVCIAFQALPLMPNSGLNTFHLAARQRVLEERIVKDVLILACRPQDEHTEAISEMQTVMPVWEEVEKGLQNGDTSLNISPNLPGDFKMMMLQAQPDYSYLDAAARRILAHPEPADQTQVSIVLQHSQGYYLYMGEAVNVLQDDINGVARIYFGIGLGIEIFLMIIWISFLIATNKSLKRNGG